MLKRISVFHKILNEPFRNRRGLSFAFALGKTVLTSCIARKICEK
jgi:hypothetical protein